MGRSLIADRPLPIGVDDLAKAPLYLTIADDNGGRPEFALEVLNRCQRLIDRRNRHSHGQRADRFRNAASLELLRAEVALLRDADALSFFSLHSNGYLDSFGAEETRKKVADTLNRMREGAKAKLAQVRLRPAVRTML